MASLEHVTIWFKNNPKFLQVADPETCKFLNQKARITASLAASTSEEDVLQNLQSIVQLLQAQYSEKGKEKRDLPSSSSDQSKKKGKKKKQVLPPSSSSSSSTADSFYQNEDDCFGIYSSVNLAEE